MPPIYDESSLFELEKKLIRKYKTYRRVKPKPIRIVAENDFAGRADDDAILVSSSFLQSNPDLKEVSDLLKHELLHYVCEKEGHSLKFNGKAAKMKILDDYTNRQLFDEPHKNWLEGRVSYEVNEKGEIVLIDKKRPSFGRFFDNVLSDGSLSIALAYRSLRKMNGLSIKEVAARSGISEAKILKIETKDSDCPRFKHEATLKKVFRAIVNKPKGSRR